MNWRLKFKGQIISAIFSAILCVILIGCMKDELPAVNSQQGDKVTFRINIPTNTQIETRASTDASEAELKIKQGYCLIYANNNTSSEPKMTYMFDVDKDITNNGNANPTIAIPKKITIGSSDIVVFILNTPFIGSGDFEERLDDVQYSQISTKFPLAGNSGFETTAGNGIPMYGEFTGFSDSVTPSMTIYRSVAKVQVKLNSPMTGSATDVANFSTANIKYKIFNLAIAGNVNSGAGFNDATTDALNSNDQNEAPKTTIVGQSIDKETVTNTSGDNYVGASYIYEYYYSTNTIGLSGSTDTPTVSAPNGNRLAIILHNSDNNKYYRLDLCHIGPEYIDVIRNHHYQIVINQVNSDGYASADEALNGDASNIIYEIIDNSGTTTISNGKYAISVGEEFYANSSITTTGTDPITVASDLRYILPAGLSLPAGVTSSITIIDPITKNPIDGNVLTASPSTLSDIATPLTVTFADLTFNGEIAFKITLGDLSYESAPITIVSTAIIGAVVNFGTDQNPIWVEVADRNAELNGINGATAGNSNTDYGSFYYWSNATDFTADLNKSYQACFNFGEGNGTWRLPTNNEMEILCGNNGATTSVNSQRKLQHINNVWTLHDDRPGYENRFVYFPLSGHYSASGYGNENVQGYYWSDYRSGTNVHPLVVGEENRTHISNYSLGGNGVGFSVRCVRNILEPEPEPEPVANCYMIPLSGTTIVIPAATRVNSFWSGDGNVPANIVDNNSKWYVEVIWADFDYTTDNKVVIKQNGATASDYGTGTDEGLNVTIKALTEPGNIIIGLKKEGTTDYLWSWHLWITDYDPDTRTDSKIWDINETFNTTGGQVHSYSDAEGSSFWSSTEYNGAVMMDRNLGAIISTGADGGTINNVTVGTKAFGMHYQWGRKDPFPHAQNTTSTPTIQTWGVVTWPNVIAGIQSKAYSIKNPYTFITATHPSDWQAQDNDSWTDELGSKSLYDPCPYGWKVAPNAVLSNFSASNPTGTPTEIDYGRLYDVGGKITAWFPAAGFLQLSTGNLEYVGRYGTYMTSTHIDTSAYLTYLYYFSQSSEGVINDGRAARAYGFSVRCLKE